MKKIGMIILHYIRPLWALYVFELIALLKALIGLTNKDNKE